MAGVGTLGVVVEAPATVVAPLRAIDWRFLLPIPPGTRFRRLLILGGPPGVVARATRAGLAQEVVSEAVPGVAIDAIAAYADAPQSIADIAGALSRDGLLYLAVDRRHRGLRASTPGRLEAMLRAAGLSVCALYALEPDARTPRAFIPLDSARAMSWHRRTTFGDRATVRVANAVRHSAVRVGGATLAALDRPYAVIASRGAVTGATPGVLREPDALSRLGTRRAPAATVMLAYGGDRVLLFPFAEDSREPLAVVKVPKTEVLVGRTETEQSEMHALRRTLDTSLATAIPEPLGIVRMNGVVAACERLVPGASIAARATDPKRPTDEKVGDLRMALAWLARFHRATEVRRTTIRASREAVVDALIEAYAHELGTPTDAALVQRLRSITTALGVEPIAIALGHGDFAAWNVLRSGDGLAVVDWEGTREGLAALDAVHFATTWLYSVRLADGADDEARCVHELLRPAGTPDRVVTEARDALGWYLRAVDVDPRLAPLLIALHRMELALRRVTQLRLHGGAMSDDQPPIEIRIVRSLGMDADRLFAEVDP